MGAIGGMLGVGGGASGSGYNVTNPVNQTQITDTYNNSQAALQQQQALLQAIQAQNGLGNQSSVYNQLQGVANGTGPNPAVAQLNQATAANTANQAALMAGQRGSSQNTGLIARQAAMQGAQNQQNAAGQAATLQANQSLNALSNMGNIANQQVSNQVGTQQNAVANAMNEQGLIYGAQQGYNSTQSQLAQATMPQQANLIGNMTGGIGSSLGSMFGAGSSAAGGASDADVLGGSGAADTFAGGDAISDGLMFAANGGMIKQMADGGDVMQQAPSQLMQPMQQPQAPAPTSASSPQSFAGKFFAQSNQEQQNYKPPTDAQKNAVATNAEAKQAGQIVGKVLPYVAEAFLMAGGGKVPALVSPGEKYLDPKDVKKVEQGANPMQVGETIPGKPKVSGAKNSYANDTVPKDLDEGGIVLPRSVTQSKNPHWAAHKFVSDILAKQGKLPPRKPKAVK